MRVRLVLDVVDVPGAVEHEKVEDLTVFDVTEYLRDNFLGETGFVVKSISVMDD